MAEYPVQISKVQAPPLREETLARDRLLEWLQVKIHRRVVLLIAEAGYGKTTLLADFSRRTRLRTMWFRLDRGDRDWVGFLAYLVAAVRIHVPDFGASTSALLRETATSAPQLDTVLDTFLRELGGLPNDPSAIVFDDFHLVDDAPDVRHILRELLARGPERMSFVFASRREPTIRLARLRALGEVAELGTNDLRFDASETARLFSETYEMRLEPSVLAELGRRTEGWAASLQLVRAAIHDRDPGQVRAFIASLSGAEGHLYDYLAEEVVGELPVDLQHFLMRTSLLETVDLVLGPIAADVDAVAARGFIEDGERHGLFGKGGPQTRHVVRAHPLVRDFLQDRLRRATGDSGIRQIHVRVAEAAESINWRTASRHYLAAGEEDDVRRVLASAIGTVLATGAHSAADDIASQLTSGGLAGAAGLVLQSRLAQQRAAVEEGRALAEQAWQVEPTSTAALLNLIAARTLAGDLRGALEAGRLLEGTAEPALAPMGRAYRQMIETSVEGSVELAIQTYENLLEGWRIRGDTHYLGVSLSNLAYMRMAMGDVHVALANANEAIEFLASAPGSVDLVSARLARAAALGLLGDMTSARDEADLAMSIAADGQRVEVALEVGMHEALVGDAARARALIDGAAVGVAADTDHGEQLLMAQILLQARERDLTGARRNLDRLRAGEERSTIAFEARRRLTKGLVMAIDRDPDAELAIFGGIELARKQHADLWTRYGHTLAALADVGQDPSAALVVASHDLPVVLSMLAEAVLTRLKDLDQEATTAVTDEAGRRPWRWRESVRRLLQSQSPSERDVAAHLLSVIGDATDVARLREAGKQRGSKDAARLGYGLARRLAERVFIDDLGRVRITVGDRAIEGNDVRRKVLALLCLLVSKARFSATRDEVVDALWPDLDPSAALNSLNQTVYFLRRVFEPTYIEDLSPAYVGQDGETIWLDPDLVDARSRRCLDIIRSMPSQPTTEGSVALAHEYHGRFALDFAYEDWSAPYRDALHAGYLRIAEQAIRMDIDTGNFGRGIFLAERAAEIDPESEPIQTALVRLYRLSGAHAAAAEQYTHYARSQRELGSEPPALSDV